MKTRMALALLGLSAILFLALLETQAGALKAGDIIVVDDNAFDGRGGVIKVDPTTGAQEVISAGGMFVAPRGVAIDRSGQIIVADLAARAIIRVNPDTAGQTLVSSGGLLLVPLAVALDSGGNIIVADAGGASGSLIRVNPSTGEQTLISSGGLFVDPHGVVVAANGEIFVSETHIDGVHAGAIIKVDPTTGSQTLISSGGRLIRIVHVTVDSTGQILAASLGFDGPLSAIVKVDPDTGGQVVVSSEGLFVSPTGVAVEASGDIIMSDQNAFGGSGGVIKVDPVSGSQTVLSPGGLFVDPTDVEIVHLTFVEIDIKPGSDPNSINLGAEGVIPVAILTTPEFDATTVDVSTLTLSGAAVRLRGKSQNAKGLEDVDADGDLDLVAQFDINELELTEGSTVAVLQGKTLSGEDIIGTDSVRVVRQ
ncbi:MAG: hypothetical protein ACRD4U_05340 [Candidatus Acidiferrales bacterium]